MGSMTMSTSPLLNRADGFCLLGARSEARKHSTRIGNPSTLSAKVRKCCHAKMVVGTRTAHCWNRDAFKSCGTATRFFRIRHLRIRVCPWTGAFHILLDLIDRSAAGHPFLQRKRSSKSRCQSLSGVKACPIAGKPFFIQKPTIHPPYRQRPCVPAAGFLTTRPTPVWTV